MGDLGGLVSQLTSSSFRRDVKLGLACLDAACTVGLNDLSVARNPDKPTQNKLKTNKQTSKQTNPHLKGSVSLDIKALMLTNKFSDYRHFEIHFEITRIF